MSNKALLIEDDDDLAKFVEVLAEDIGYSLDRADNGAQGLELALAGDYSFVLLDMNLPKLGGTEVCRAIRAEKASLPIIMVTSESDEINKVLLLELGADDYVTKPFSVMELKARIKAVLRRANSAEATENPSDAIFEHKGLSIDFVKRKISYHDKPLDLTAAEFDLLALLATNPGRPYSRDQIIQELYGYEVSGYEQSVNSHINRIRNKIEPNKSDPIFLKTVRGVGYCFADPETD